MKCSKGSMFVDFRCTGRAQGSQYDLESVHDTNTCSIMHSTLNESEAWRGIVTRKRARVRRGGGMWRELVSVTGVLGAPLGHAPRTFWLSTVAECAPRSQMSWGYKHFCFHAHALSKYHNSLYQIPSGYHCGYMTAPYVTPMVSDLLADVNPQTEMLERLGLRFASALEGFALKNQPTSRSVDSMGNNC